MSTVTKELEIVRTEKTIVIVCDQCGVEVPREKANDWLHIATFGSREDGDYINVGDFDTAQHALDYLLRFGATAAQPPAVAEEAIK